MKKIVRSTRWLDTSALMPLPRDAHLPMRLHGNTVFIPENQEKRAPNGCIIDWLDREVRVEVDVRETRDAGLV